MDPITIKVDTFCKLSGLGRTKTFGLMKSGALKSKKVDGTRLILFASARQLLEEETSE